MDLPRLCSAPPGRLPADRRKKLWTPPRGSGHHPVGRLPERLSGRLYDHQPEAKGRFVQTEDSVPDRNERSEAVSGPRPRISVVIPVYQSSAILMELYRRLTATLTQLVDSHEIVFVDDRSADPSWPTLLTLARLDSRVVACRLSRNFGQHLAITAGLCESAGEHVVVMDCDLQDPPEAIPDLWAAAQEGVPIVLAKRKAAYHSRHRIMANRWYFWTLGWLTGQPIDGELGSFSMISRPVVDAFLQFRENERHYLFILYWLGFERRTIEYNRQTRSIGGSSYSFGKLLTHALQGVFFQTTVFLRLVMYGGFLISLLGLLVAALIILEGFRGSLLPGWTSLIVLQLVMSGLTISAVGTVGLYVARIFEQSKQRPLYILEERVQTTGSRQPTDLQSARSDLARAHHNGA
jgi:glycosyltransferase involved in cell wall biosynthesis